MPGPARMGPMSGDWADDAEPADRRPAFRRSFAYGIVAAIGLALLAAVIALSVPTVQVGGQEFVCWAPALGLSGGIPEPAAGPCATATTTRLVVSTLLAIAALVIGAVTTIRATTVPREER